MNNFRRYALLWFAILTVGLTYGVYFLPLPAEQKSLLVPVLAVFVPTVVCVPLVLLTEGRAGWQQLLSTMRLRRGGLSWLVIAVGAGALMRVAVLIAGKLVGLPVKADFSVPGTWFIVFSTIPLALFEEIGWRSYALERLLKSRSPLVASLLIGVPWAILHLVLLLPGMMSAGSPVLANLVVLMALSVVLTWAYVRSGHSVWTVTLLHGVQNGLSVINRGLTLVESSWLMMAVYLGLAALLVLFDRNFFLAPSTAPPFDTEEKAHLIA